LPLYRIQATERCGAELYCLYTVYRLQNIVPQSCIAFIPYTGYRTLWRRAVLPFYRIQATERCGAELYCLYTVYRLQNVVAQSCIAFLPYTGYWTCRCIIMCAALWTAVMATVCRSVRKIAISDCLLCRVCLSVRQSAWNSCAATGWILVGLDIWVLFENLWREFKFY